MPEAIKIEDVVEGNLNDMKGRDPDRYIYTSTIPLRASHEATGGGNPLAIFLQPNEVVARVVREEVNGPEEFLIDDNNLFNLGYLLEDQAARVRAAQTEPLCEAIGYEACKGEACPLYIKPHGGSGRHDVGICREFKICFEV